MRSVHVVQVCSALQLQCLTQSSRGLGPHTRAQIRHRARHTQQPLQICQRSLSSLLSPAAVQHAFSGLHAVSHEALEAFCKLWRTISGLLCHCCSSCPTRDDVASALACQAGM